MPSLIKKIHVDRSDISGFRYGMDVNTPVRFVFTNRVVPHAYTTFDLGLLAASLPVQAWMNSTRAVVMTLNELKLHIQSLTMPTTTKAS